MVACQGVRVVTTTHSQRSRAAASAVRAWAVVSWLWSRVVRWAWRAARTGLCASAPQVARQAHPPSAQPAALARRERGEQDGLSLASGA